MEPQVIHQFQETIWDYFRSHARDLPWRQEPFDAYHILVSEIMLQQTQVSRVTEKYRQFLEQFPTIESLAIAPLAEVLIMWSGLGYNRRARYLHEAAKQLAPNKQPWTLIDLEACKGIGYNTAAAVITYSYNQAIPFVETNIRTVLIHYFLPGQEAVDDRTLMDIMTAVLDYEHPREFMWAMMDYGSHLKATVGNVSRQSKLYTKQSVFQGSARQVRGEVLRQLASGPKTEKELQTAVTDDRLLVILQKLESEGLISRQGNGFVLGT